jgi:hypothetical protein
VANVDEKHSNIDEIIFKYEDNSRYKISAVFIGYTLAFNYAVTMN